MLQYQKNKKWKWQQLWVDYNKMLSRKNYSESLEKIEEYLEHKDFLLTENHYRKKNEPFVIKAYLDQIQCLIKIDLNETNISKIRSILISAWLTDSSSNKDNFKKYIYTLETQLLYNKNDSNNDSVLYFFFTYPFFSAKRNKIYMNELFDFFMKYPDIVELLYKCLIEDNNIDNFHFIPFCYSFREYYESKKEYNKFIKLADIFNEKLSELQTEEYKVLSDDITKLSLIRNHKLNLYHLGHYNWLFDGYVNLNKYDDAERYLEKEKAQIEYEYEFSKNGQMNILLRHRLETNRTKSAIISLFKLDLINAKNGIDKILQETRHYNNMLSIKYSLAGKICILLYEENSNKALEFVRKYNIFYIKINEREKFRGIIEWICNLFLKSISDTDKKNNFYKNYIAFLDYYKSETDKKENSILMANAQLGLWTNIILHELKGYLAGISTPLGEMKKYLNNPVILSEICDELDSNCKKVFSILNLLRERTDPTHTISVDRIDRSDFDKIDKMLLLSILKTGKLINITSNNNLPIHFYFYSDKFYIEHILTNLIKNAVEAIEEKQKTERIEGKIIVTIEYLDDSDKIQFTVEDNGPGFIKKINLNSVRPFYSTKKGSIRGLGIYICKTFVNTLNGDISIDKSDSEGSRISFWIPANKKGENNGK